MEHSILCNSFKEDIIKHQSSYVHVLAGLLISCATEMFRVSPLSDGPACIAL